MGWEGDGVTIICARNKPNVTDRSGHKHDTCAPGHRYIEVCRFAVIILIIF